MLEKINCKISGRNRNCSHSFNRQNAGAGQVAIQEEDVFDLDALPPFRASMPFASR